MKPNDRGENSEVERDEEARKEEERLEKRGQKRAKSIVRLVRIPWRTALRVARRVAKKLMLPIGCILICTCFVFSLAVGLMNLTVCNRAEDRIVDADTLSELGVTFDCIVVLGCRVYKDGRLSPMLEDRVTVGVSLYGKGICDRILMSGDHKDDSYNEVDPMREAAIEMGVPSEAILTDPLGLSTYDSLARVAAEHAGARVVIVTQEYHLYRALYIAEKLGLDAYGVSADLRPYTGQWKRDAREVLARCKDLLLTWAKPKPVADMIFLLKKVEK